MTEALLADLLAQGEPVMASRPWPRACVASDTWITLAEGLRDGHWSLVALWGEVEMVHMAVRPPGPSAPAVASLACPQGRFPSVGRLHPPALRLERTITDLFGLVAADGPDPRPWLDHGRWPVHQPLGAASPPVEHGPYPFLPSRGESLHQIPVGPVHAGIIEPGHFRFTCGGETVVRLEERLGYVHKGIESLMAGAEPRTAARLAGRVSGDSTVAYGLAFAMAIEAALGIVPPPRAVLLRALMAELERLANHFGDIGAICNDAAFSIMHAECGVLREHVLRAADACFGHRLMMDRVMPGGVAVDLTAAGEALLRQLVDELPRLFAGLVALYDATPSLQDRTVGTGTVAADLVNGFAAGGFVGRGSGRNFDARRDVAYPPYDQLSFNVPVRSEGDVNARVWIRIREVEQSLALIAQILPLLRPSPVRVRIQRRSSGGLAARGHGAGRGLPRRHLRLAGHRR